MANRLSRLKYLWLKPEPTKGVDAVPTGAANALLLRDVSISPVEGQTIDRNLIRSYFGGYESFQVETMVRFSGEVEFQGSGAAGTAPAWGMIMKAAGFSETVVASTSVTYAPVSAGVPTLTGYYGSGSDTGNGLRHIMLGCYIDSVEFAIGARGLPSVRFSGMGLLGAISDQPFPSQTLTAFKTPVVPTTINTPSIALCGYTPILNQFNMSVRNTISHPPFINQDELVFTDRAVEGSAIIKTPLLAEKDYFSVVSGNTTGQSLSLQHGAAAGYRGTFASTNIDLSTIAYSDVEGVDALNIGFRVPPTTAGNDEFTLVWT